jgi:hypothetical protein
MLPLVVQEMKVRALLVMWGCQMWFCMSVPAGIEPGTVAASEHPCSVLPLTRSLVWAASTYVASVLTHRLHVL